MVLVDESAVQIAIASVGIAGTLAGALLTQVLGGRAERERRRADDHSRWLADRLRVNAQFLAESLKLERDLWSAAAQLDPDEREVRMPGFTTILLTPATGLPGVLDGTMRGIIVDAVEEAFARLDVLEEMTAEIALVGTVAEVNAATELHEALWEATGCLESYASSNATMGAVLRCRSAREAFAQAARTGLRTGGRLRTLDSRPKPIET